MSFNSKSHLGNVAFFIDMIQFRVLLLFFFLQVSIYWYISVDGMGPNYDNQ